MSFARTLAANSIYRVWNTGTVFFITVLLSRLAGPQGYGLFSLLLINAGFVNLVTSLGTEAAITFKTAANKLDTKKTVSFIYVIFLFQVVCLALFEAFYYLWTGSFWNFSIYNLQWAWAGVVFFISISVIEKYSALLYGHQLYTLCNQLLLAVNSLLLVVLTCFFFYQHDVSNQVFLYFFIATYAVQAVALVLFFHWNYKDAFIFKMPDRSTVAAFFSYASIVYITNLIQFIAYRVDFWLVDVYQDETALGLYALAVRLAQLFWILPLLYAGIIFPKWSSTKNNFNHLQLATIIRLMNALNIAAGVFCIILVSGVLPLVFGAAFANSILPFQILLPGVIAFSITTIVAAYFAAINKLKINFWGSLLCAIVISILDLLLIPDYGIVGAAIASSIGYIITTIYFLVVYKKQSSMPLKGLLLPTFNDVKQVQQMVQQYLKKKS